MDRSSTRAVNDKPGFTKSLGVSLLVLSFIASLGAQANDQAGASRFSPATFKSGDESLESRFFVPNSKKDKEVTLFCSAVVSVRGVIEGQRCNWDHENKPYRIPANNAVRNVRLNPATVDGEKVIAYIKYALKITHKGGESTLKLFPHHFVNSQYYGDNYIAAQSYSPGTEINANNTAFFGKPWLERDVQRKCVKNARVFLKMKIESDGKASGVEVMDKPRPKSCGKSVSDVAVAAKYIPAFVNDQPVASIYVEKYLAEKTSRTGSLR